MRVGIPKEILAGETRVAAIPETVGKLAKAGIEVAVEGGAGASAQFADDAYRAVGAQIEPDAAKVFAADAILKVRSPGEEELQHVRPGTLLISFLHPFAFPNVVRQLAEGGVTALAMEYIPRISRAQSMDALTSMSAVAGYKAVLLAADALGKFFPLAMTPAGTIAPARVLVLGAGVAGLQAIGTAKRLGAVVEACDVRPAAKEQVESLGASFVNLGMSAEQAEGAGGYAKEIARDQHERELQIIHERVRKADVVIATALVPGKRAPVLVTEAMVQDMAPGSVIVDLAAEQGGNCACTEPGRTVVRHGVTLLGPLDVAASMPQDASRMYARNVLALFQSLYRDGRVVLDETDEIVRGVLVTRAGKVVHEAVRKEIGGDSG